MGDGGSAFITFDAHPTGVEAGSRFSRLLAAGQPFGAAVNPSANSSDPGERIAATDTLALSFGGDA